MSPEQIKTFAKLRFCHRAFTVAGLLWTLLWCVLHSYSKFEFRGRYADCWSRAAMAQNLEIKSRHLDELIHAVQQGRANGYFAEYDAIFDKNVLTSLDASLANLTDLREQVDYVRTIQSDPVAYQAGLTRLSLLERRNEEWTMETIFGCYLLRNQPLVWSWIGVAYLSVGVLLLTAGLLEVLYGLSISFGNARPSGTVMRSPSRITVHSRGH